MTQTLPPGPDPAQSWMSSAGLAASLTTSAPKPVPFLAVVVSVVIVQLIVYRETLARRRREQQPVEAGSVA